MRVVLDTNVIISALHSIAGPPAQIVRLALQGKFQLISSHALLDELRGVLREKFEWPDDSIHRVVSVLSELAILVAPDERISVVSGDDADNRVLECAADSQADFLVTGDRRHLLPLRQFRGTKIVNPADFLKELARGTPGT